MAWWTDQRLHPKTKSKFVIVFGSTFFIPSVKTVSKPKIDFDTKEYRLLNHKFNYPGNGTWQPIELTFVDMNGLGDKSDTFDTSAFLWQILNNTGYAYPYLDGSSDTSNNAYYNNVADGKDVFSGGHHLSTKISFRDDPNTDIRERRSFRTITTPEKSSTISNSFGKGLNGNIDYENAHYARQKISIYQLSPESKFDEGTDKNPSGAEIVECWHLINPIVKSIGWGDLSYDSDDLVEYTMSIVYDWAIFDREKIGKDFVVDSLPYQDFMKNYGLAQTAIDQELRIQSQTLDDIRDFLQTDNVDSLKDFSEKINSNTPQDLDGDGLISDVEASLWSKQNQDIREGLAIEADMRLADENRSAFEELPKENQEALRARAELEREEAELQRAALDEAFSDENIQESLDEGTQDFADALKEQLQNLEDVDKANKDFIKQQREHYEEMKELDDILRKANIANIQEQREQNKQNNPELLQTDSIQYVQEPETENSAGTVEPLGSLTNNTGYSTDLEIKKADRSRNDLADLEDDTE